MKRLGDILKESRKSMSLTASDVVSALAEKGRHISIKTLYGYENNSREPDNITFLLLCSIYGILDILKEFGLNNTGTSVLSGQEHIMLEKYRRLDKHGLNVIDTLLDMEIKRIDEKAAAVAKPESPAIIKKSAGVEVLNPEAEKEPERMLPLYDYPASAGLGVFAGEGQYELVDVPDKVPYNASFGIQIRGESMEPRIKNGAIVWVKQQPDVDFGEICIVVINGDGYCKIKTIEGFKSCNPKYKMLKINEYDECSIRGKVVYIDNP